MERRDLLRAVASAAALSLLPGERALGVADGSCMASTACQNRSITYMALTARGAAHAVSALRRNEL